MRLVIERVRSEDGTEVPVGELGRTMADDLTSRP